MRFLEDTRRERHKIGPEEIQDWKQELSGRNRDTWIRPGITDNISAEAGLNKRSGLVYTLSYTGCLMYRDSMEQEEAQLILDLQNFISKKVVDVEMMANLLVAKDGSSSNQVSSRNIEECFKAVGIELDTALLERVVKLTETRKNHCSIPKIISLIKSGTNPDDDNGAKGPRHGFYQPRFMTSKCIRRDHRRGS